VNLADDRTPSVTVKIAGKPSEVRGNVLDRNGKGILGARVSIIGEDGSVATGDGGLFIIATRIPTGQPITLLIEKDGFSPLRQQHLTGSSLATVVLDSSTTPQRKNH
jgi:hypothetical protein